MADNVELNATSGGETVATDLISGAHYQRIKLGHGPDGTYNEVEASDPLPVTDPGLEQSKGNVTGTSLIHKFGRNTAVGTTFVPVALGGVYQTPQPASATSLRVKAGGDANDTAAGSGAREVTLQGLDETGALATEAVATAGASASSATTTTFIRLFRAWVSSSGTYATATTGSHSAAITIENSAGGTDWLTIDATGFPRGQSEVGVYTIPNGYTGYLEGYRIFTDSTKTTDYILFRRESILDAAAPYEAMREVSTGQIKGENATIAYGAPVKLTGPCDIGFMAKVGTGTAQVTAEFDLILVAD